MDVPPERSLLPSLSTNINVYGNFFPNPKIRDGELSFSRGLSELG